MKKIFAVLLGLLISLNAGAQFVNGQVLTATALNNAIANPTITGGSINGVSIGNVTPGTGNFTTMTLTNPLGVQYGGTGRNTLTAHGVLVGEGGSAINSTAAGTTGQMFLGVTAGDPVWGGNPTITGGSIDGAPVGAGTPSTGRFTSLTASGTLTGFTGRLIAVQVFNASGTYTPTTGATTAIVEAIGGGGGGGGAAATGAGTVAPAQGGSAGAYAKVFLPSLSSQTVTIGTGGGGGNTSGSAGTAGGQTTFGTIITCPGGLGGSGAIAVTPPFFFRAAGINTVASTTATAIILSTGNTGGLGIAMAAGGSDISAGEGAASPFGGGAGSVNNTTQAGTNATTKGTGGGGALSTSTGAGQTGGTGANGVVIVYEYSN